MCAPKATVYFSRHSHSCFDGKTTKGSLLRLPVSTTVVVMNSLIMPFPTYAGFLLRHGKAQKSAQATITLSTALPDSGVPSAQASKAASAAVIELTQALDETIERLDLEGRHSQYLSCPT